MSDSNFQLKKAHKLYIWTIISRTGGEQIFLTSKANPANGFWFEIGQFIQGEIKSGQMIGHHLVLDHWGRDISREYFSNGKQLDAAIIEGHNTDR